jgi:hypothetical protein
MTDDLFHLHATVDLIEKDLVTDTEAMLGAAWQALAEALNDGEGLLDEDDAPGLDAEEGVLYLCADDGDLPARATRLLLTQYVDAESWAVDALLSDRLGDDFDAYLVKLGARISHHYGQLPTLHQGSAQGPLIMTDRDSSLTWTFGERKLSLQRGMRCGDGDFHYDLWLGVSAA